MMNPRTPIPVNNKVFYFNGLCRSELAEQQQDEEHDQNDAANPHSGMAHAIAVPAKPAGKAAQQVNDHDDDEYRSERHGTLPEARPANGNLPPRGQRKAYPGLWFQRRNLEPGALFVSSLPGLTRQSIPFARFS
jgi:hypothetical protein